MAVPTARTQATSPPRHGGLIDRFSVVLVAVAATMWAFDIYFRSHLVHLTASQIVVVEDGLITVFLLVFLVRGWPEMRRMSWRGWLAVTLIGIGPQAVRGVERPGQIVECERA